MSEVINITTNHRLTKLQTLTITILIFVFVGCNLISGNNPDDDPVPVSFEVLGAISMGSTDEGYPCRLNTYNLDMGHQEDMLSAIELTITNREDFEKYIICVKEEINEPDFDSYIILAGLSTIQPNCVFVKEQDMYLSQGTLVYEVTIGDMACTVPDRAQYIVIISKNYLNYPIVFKVQKEA